MTKNHPEYLVYTSQADGTPDLITGVTVAPLTASVAKSANTTFTATAVGSGQIDTAVTWALEVESGGTISNGTKIESTAATTGKLTVASDQGTTKKLYVYAITANGIKSVPAVVTVTSA